jgi:hypothetical protein
MCINSKIILQYSDIDPVINLQMLVLNIVSYLKNGKVMMRKNQDGSLEFAQELIHYIQ